MAKHVHKLLTKYLCRYRTQARRMEVVKTPFVVSVEGNIGSGKSTLIKYFSQFADVEAHQEPLNKWCNVRGHNLLNLLYEDPSRHSFAFQSYVQQSRLEIRTTPCTKKVMMMERSLQNNRYCFVENARKNGSISEPEYAVLVEWYDWIEKNVDIHLDLVVYLRTDPQVVYQRMRKRARPEEKCVSLQYLEELHESYEEWFKKLAPAPVLVVDGNEYLDDMQKQYRLIQDKVMGSCVMAN